jgi:hypothetical protein
MSNTPKLDPEQIKQYNKSVETYREQARTLSVQIDMSEKEIVRLCSELSAELGEEVNKDNVETVASRIVQQYQTSLENGTAIFNRIESEQQAIQYGAAAVPVVNTVGPAALAEAMRTEENPEEWNVAPPPPMPMPYSPPPPPPADPTLQ